MDSEFKSKLALRQAELSEALVNELVAACYKYSDEIPLALAVGAIELAKLQIIEEAP